MNLIKASFKSSFLVLTIILVFILGCERNKFELAEVPAKKNTKSYSEQFDRNIPPSK